MNDTNNSKKVGNLGQFILGKTIGEGTFGRVKIATHITTGEKVKSKNLLTAISLAYEDIIGVL